MMTTNCIDVPLPFALKKKGQDVYNDSDGDIGQDENDDFLSMPMPLASINNSILVDESNNEFLRLTTMVRAVYLSYLHKCLLGNYLTCYAQRNNDITNEVKKCADQLELHAVRLALEATLYRQNMLRMIADIKSHTIKKKPYKKLVIFLETTKDKIDVAVQTDNIWSDLHEVDNTQNVYITSNCEEALEIMNSNNSHTSENVMKNIDDQMNIQTLQEIINEKSNDISQGVQDQSDFQIMDDTITKAINEDENSQDSLIQHMEDMFCESDDSSDITKLIEKHSGVTKANIDKEINKICLEANSNLFDISQNDNIPKLEIAKVNTSKGKISFSRYKELQNRKGIKSKKTNKNDISENKQKQKLNAIWFVERVNQVLQLKARMTELSLINYRKLGKIKKRFLKLFGECDEEMMLESSICIEDHLPACKERIAPWIVKYLMPFFKKRRIKNRQLFKILAKYIADMLIIENTFPERECVSKFIKSYFKNRKTIKIEQDIYL